MLDPGEEEFLESGAGEHNVDGDAARSVNQGEDPRGFDEPVWVLDPQLEPRLPECRDERRGRVLTEVHGDVDVGGQSDGAVKNRRLGTEDVPANAEGGERAGEIGEKVSEW